MHDSDWSSEAVCFASSRELLSGTAENTFSPNAEMTRAMLFTVLARYDGQETSGGSNWYEKAQNWVKGTGISDGSQPEMKISREQLVTIIYRYAGSPDYSGGSLNNFSDADSVSKYAENAFCWAIKEGIISGKGNGLLDPKGTATRAETAAILMRFIISASK
ncbi:MAG: S-layer homology domain-containing protein [Clostridiales bacterium]|nr:S-layer homology domain-containing protein [Clostridiales bacterium]